MRFLGPLTGDDEVGNPVLHEVHRDHRELKRCAALHEEHLIIVRDLQQITDVGFRLVNDLLVHLRSMGHLHDGHAASSVIQHLRRCFLKHLFRQDSRTGGKIINPFHFAVSSSNTDEMFLLYRGKVLRYILPFSNAFVKKLFESRCEFGTLLYNEGKREK